MLARLSIATAFVLALCASAIAQTAPTLREINSINGFDQAVQQYRPMVAKAIDNIPGQKPEPLVDGWQHAVSATFDPTTMIPEIEALMSPKLSQSDLTTLFAFYDSDFGRKISALEVAAQARQARGERLEEGAAIYATLAEKDPERLALYTRLIDGLQAVDVGEATALNVTYAMVSGMMGAAKQPATDDQIAAIVKNATPTLREAVEEACRSSTAYAYRDLSIEDLRRYVEFLETPEGRRYYAVGMNSLGKVVTSEALKFGHSLMVAMGQRKA